MPLKLYLQDAYLQTFSSTVTDRLEQNGKPGLVLEQTAFYPTSGGQPHDTGTINGIPVIDVIEDDRLGIVHLLEKPVQADTVEGLVDWERRFDHMQQHTGQHILSQAFLQICNAQTLSFHLGDAGATIDIDQPGLDGKTISSVENTANKLVFEDRDVIAHIVSKDDMDRFPVRKPPTVAENIRILEVKDFDYSPCGGTHCARTGEVGIIKIRQFENYKGGSRIHFVCGGRALLDYQQKTETLKTITGLLSTGEAALGQSILKLQEELKALRQEHNLLKKQQLEYEAQTLAKEFKKYGGMNVLKKIFDDRDPRDLKILGANMLEGFSDRVVLFGSRSAKNASLLFLCSEELELDVARLLQSACEVIGGRGGGRPNMAQGGGPEVEKLELALQGAVEAIR